MTTAEAIEAITDAALFEIIATRVLRLVDSDYHRAEHLGVNAAGKTIKGPVDGFCKVSGTSPSRYVASAFSTDKVDKIERKLLFDHTKSSGKKAKSSDDGDLLKFVKLASSIKAVEPDATFVLTFCTNKQPDAGLMKRAYQKAESLGIELRFLGRSQIRDCLDIKREGQWLRKIHLGIEAELLSLPMLEQLSSQSLEEYALELFCDSTQIIPTTTTKALSNVISMGRSGINLLIGASGSGKSVASYLALKQIFDSGGIGLWIPADFIESSDSLVQALSRALQSLSSNLGHSCGQELLALVSETKRQFVLVVDDLNRTNNVVRNIQKLITWQRKLVHGSTQQSSKSTVSASDLQIVIPVWSQYWSSLKLHSTNEYSTDEVHTKRMSREEAVACIKLINDAISDLAAAELSRQLEYDPILIGLWSKMSSESASNLSEITGSELIGKFIEETVEKESAAAGLLPADSRILFDEVAQEMLSNRNMYPTWKEITSWLSSTQVEALRRFTISAKLCRVVTRYENDQFEMRHDRLLEALLSRPISVAIDDIANNTDLLSDPFLAESVALALKVSADSSKPPEVGGLSPLAIIISLKYLTDGKSDFEKAILSAAKTCLSEIGENQEFCYELSWEAGKILQTIENKFVLDATEVVATHRDFWGTRLLNGSVKYGKFFVWHSAFFSPNGKDVGLEDLVARAIDNHGIALADQLVAELKNKDELSANELSAALTLAGYLACPTLAEPAVAAYSREKVGIHEALWATLRCSAEPEKTLKPVLNTWRAFSDEANDYGTSERNRVLDSIRFAVRKGLPNEVVKHLVQVASNEEDPISWCVTILLQEVDSSDAIRFVVAKVAQIQKELEGTDLHSPWATTLLSDWDSLQLGRRKVSAVAKNTVLDLWKETDDQALKDQILRIWLRMTDSLDEFRELPNDVEFPDSALWRRARLGDIRVSAEVREKLKTDNHWFHVATNIWTTDFLSILDAAIDQLIAGTPKDEDIKETNDHHTLAETIRDIPAEHSIPLLEKHWQRLKHSRYFFQAALCIGGDESLKLVDESLRDPPANWEPFKYIASMFGFSTVGKRDQISARHFDALAPYVEKLDGSSLHSIIWWLSNNSLLDDPRFATFRREFDSRCEIHGDDANVFVNFRRNQCATEEDLINELDDCESRDIGAWHWAETCNTQGIPIIRTRSIFREWFSKDSSPTRLKLVANIVQRIGSREDGEWLLECQASFGDDSSQVVVDNAVFGLRRRTLA